MSNPFADALKLGAFVAGQACADCCLSIHADGPIDPDSGWNEAKMLATLHDHHTTPGHLHIGPHSDCVHADQACEDDCDCEHDPFSSVACSLCGTTVTGSRDAVILIRHELLDQP